MPIFEYVCRKCEVKFEMIVQRGSTLACPACASKRVEQQLSVFAARTADIGFSTRDLPSAPCGSCGDPRGPGSCSTN